MGDQSTNAILAIILGTGAAILLFAPVAAYQYRLDGKLQPRDLAILLSGAIYGLSLWTYTLLPMPVPDSYQCKGKQLDPLGSIRLIFTDDPGGALGLLRDPAFMQVALNVLLFVPLGYFIRVIAHRGVVVATVVGFAVSLLIETTQTTGVWNLYDCAYRLFDVDDLIVNTLGAIGGSLLSYVFADRRDDATPPLPTHVSFGRRLVGMASDVIVSAIIGGALAAAYRGWTVYGPGTYHPDAMTAVLIGGPWLVQTACVLGSGRTIGAHVVAVRSVARGAVVPARVIKLLAGVSPIFALVWLSASQPVAAGVGVLALGLISVVVAWRTAEHRGLSNVLARMDLKIAAEEVLHHGDGERGDGNSTGPVSP